MTSMDDIVYYYPMGHESHFEAGHPERPERIIAIHEALSNYGLWEGFKKVKPISLGEDLLKTVHTPAYLNILEMTCRRSGHLDADTYTTSTSWTLAHNSAGGAAAVAQTVWEGSSRRGFALTRPPGHHAMRGQGMGFCLLNNIAIAAQYLITNNTVKKVAIIDLDLHHGNGTQDIFWDRDEVFYISIHQSPLYPGTGMIADIGIGRGKGWTANFPLPPGSGDKAYLSIMDEIILPLLDQRTPEMILVSYGFDPHWKDPLGKLLLTANGYGELITRLCDWSDAHCNGRLALFLEGGYDLEAAGACSTAVVSALLGEEWTDSLPCPYRESNSWISTLVNARSVWNL